MGSLLCCYHLLVEGPFIQPTNFSPGSCQEGGISVFTKALRIDGLKFFFLRSAFHVKVAMYPRGQVKWPSQEKGIHSNLLLYCLPPPHTHTIHMPKVPDSHKGNKADATEGTRQ